MTDRQNQTTPIQPDPTATKTHRSIPARLLIGWVYVYRYTLGPFLGGQCRYWPTCSEYMIQAIDKHGPWRGLCKGIGRICRCHPFSKGGYDPP